MDGIKLGEIKSPHAGLKSGLMCTTQMKNWKIKEEANRQIELDSPERKNVHANERIKESQWICHLPARIAAVKMQTPPHFLQRPESVSKTSAILEISDLGSHIEDEMSTHGKTHVVQMLVYWTESNYESHQNPQFPSSMKRSVI
jgi:hypothetical protein